jgi:ankyrin repeat protein
MEDAQGNISCVTPAIAAAEGWSETDVTGIHDTALMSACGDGNLDHIRLLLGCSFGKVNLNSSMMNSGWTALMYACQNGHLEVVKELFKYNETLTGSAKININIQTHEGDTALIISCSFGENEQNNQHDIVKILLEKGADINITNFQGESALTTACITNYEEGLKVLLEWPALTKETAQRAYLDVIDDTTIHEKTKKHIIIHYNKNLPKLRHLILEKADLTAEDISKLPSHIQHIINDASRTGGKRKRRTMRRKGSKRRRTKRFKKYTKCR